MDMQELIHIFYLAKESNVNICVESIIPGRQSHELIITLNDNLDYKLKEYKNDYNNYLISNKDPDAKIVNAFLVTWPQKVR